MHLFGVIHDRHLLANTWKVIERTCDIPGRKVMLELPPNIDELKRKRVSSSPFFDEIRRRFLKAGCGEILCGDQEPTIPKNPNPLLLAIFPELSLYPNNRRNEIMANNVRLFQPDIVVVGGGHRNQLKELFPSAHYTVFQDQEMARTGIWGSYEHRTRGWYYPDRVITFRG